MKRPLVIGAGVLATAVLSVGVLGGGSASADIADFAGKTYGKVSEALAKSNKRAVISTVVGDQLATDDCIVTGIKASGFLDSSGDAEDKHAVLVNLNCNAAVAAPGAPGNSVMTPEGKLAKAQAVTGAKFAKHPEWCAPDGKYAQQCANLCKKNSSVCTDEVLQAIAS